MFSVKENDAFMLGYDQGRESLPVYVNGIVDKRRSVFLQGATRASTKTVGFTQTTGMYIFYIMPLMVTRIFMLLLTIIRSPSKIFPMCASAE